MGPKTTKAEAGYSRQGGLEGGWGEIRQPESKALQDQPCGTTGSCGRMANTRQSDRKEEITHANATRTSD